MKNQSMEPSLELLPALLYLPVVVLLGWAEISWEIAAWCRARQGNLVCSGFGICSVPWVEQFPPQTKLHFPGVRISAEVKFDVFNWYHHVHWWKIASIRGAQQGRSEQQGFLGYFNRENGSRHKWRCWGLVGCGTVSADAVFGCRSRALKKMKHLGVEKE